MDIKHTNVYTDLEVFPVYNFFKCLGGNLEYIYKDREGEINNNITKLWGKLYNKYFTLTSNSEHQQYFRLVLEIEWLKNRLFYVPVLINQLLKTPKNNRKEIIQEIKKWRVTFNSEKDIDKCLNLLNNSKTKLKRKESELEELNKKNSKLKDSNISLEKQSVKLQRRLGVTPDIFKDSVIKWLAYWDELKELSDKK